MAIIRLDRDESAPVAEGFTLISSEVEFLTLATDGRPLHIRGARLCNWAEVFFSGRNEAYEETRSYHRELRGLFPSLSAAQISDLVDLLGAKLETLERPLQIDHLVNAVAPHSLWHEPPSVQHLAEWLVWLDEYNGVEGIEPLLEHYTARWKLDDLPFDQQLYDIRAKEGAQAAIYSWLGLSDRDHFSVKETFPLEIPSRYRDAARQVWREEMIRSHGAIFERISRQKTPFSLQKIAADEAYQYYLRNRNDLDESRIRDLIPYLSDQQVTNLRRIIPPAIPSELPPEPKSIVSWYVNEYLPYRTWERDGGLEEGQKVATRFARQFEEWYLENYPRGLNGGSLHHWLSFNKMSQVTCPESGLILVIVLDGMHVPDSHVLIQSIFSQTQRLSVVTQEYVFAPIPTVTRFAKDALFKGVPPNRAVELDPIARILPERQSPALRLHDAERGKVYIWRVLEPDETYHHKNTSENLRHDVDGRLEAEARKIKEIVESIPDDVTLQIVLTTDHGRLLSETHKSISVPDNMESHGRAAWGVSSLPITTGTYTIDNDVAYLLGSEYGMSYNVALPLDEGAFKENNNRSGSELFPHGGIFPEEVILPWIVLARDVVQPNVSIMISGNGQARRDGVYQISVINSSDVELILETITMIYRTGAIISLESDKQIPAMQESQISIPYNPWPSAHEVESVDGLVRMRLPNQLVYEYTAQVSLSSKDMYTRPTDNILEDLD